MYDDKDAQFPSMYLKHRCVFETRSNVGSPDGVNYNSQHATQPVYCVRLKHADVYVESKNNENNE